jgi:hypothetical protein
LADFGPICNYWEGGGMGEKIIQQMKPLWNGFRKHWQIILLDKLLKKMATDHIRQHSMGRFSKKQSNLNEGKQFHVYKSRDEAYDTFPNRRSMSMIQLDNGNFVIACTNKIYITLMCTDYFGNISGCHYHHWHIAQHDMHQIELEGQIAWYCLLLPKMTSTGLPTSSNDLIYTVIDHDWTNIQSNKMFSTPTINDIL